MSTTVFDVIVLGGGPAGLASALHLAEHGVSVLVLERKAIGTTQKSWLTFDYIIKDYALEECVRNAFVDVAFSCYLGNSYSFKNHDFIYPLHEERALEVLAQKAKSSGALVHDEEAFINYSIDTSTNGIRIQTTKRTYEARIAVDAMGRDSPILRSNGLKNDSCDMGCVVFLLKNVNQKNDNRLFLYDSFFPGSDYFWVVPLEDDRMRVGIFFFSTLTDATLKGKTEKLKRYMEARGFRGEVYNTRMGNIPLGGQNYVNTGKILCIGDSCNTALPSSGFSFSRCLDESRILAQFVTDYLTNKASIKDYRKTILRDKIPGIEVHLIISDMLSKFPDPLLNKAIGAMDDLDEEFLISFLTGRDLSINFAINALRAIFNTFSLTEVRSLPLQQIHLRHMVNLYDLLVALPQAKIKDHLIHFVRGLTGGTSRGSVK
ncbi:MAG: NAD(P)/FAD-dependent oxidoreductase [Deltaproteobacteria bacterium]|nr:NAD(P)/FAD-dependent oxidoreductase [Deltaproteobacteria bacterium]